MGAEESQGPGVSSGPLLALEPRARPRLPDGPYVVAGLGQAGQAAVDALCRVTGSERVLASDRYPNEVPKRVRRALEAAGVRAHLGSQNGVLDLPPSPRTLVKSPGIPIDAPVLQRAREHGVEVIDELELGWRLNATPTIAVTGHQRQDHDLDAGGGRAREDRPQGQSGRKCRHGPAALGIEGRPRPDRLRGLELPARGLPIAVAGGRCLHQSARHDHLPRHGTMRRYGELKRSLFMKDGEPVRLAVVDTDRRFRAKAGR